MSIDLPPPCIIPWPLSQAANTNVDMIKYATLFIVAAILNDFIIFNLFDEVNFIDVETTFGQAE
jgi:hypothetical protein